MKLKDLLQSFYESFIQEVTQSVLSEIEKQDGIKAEKLAAEEEKRKKDEEYNEISSALTEQMQNHFDSHVPTKIALEVGNEIGVSNESPSEEVLRYQEAVKNGTFKKPNLRNLDDVSHYQSGFDRTKAIQVVVD